MRVGSMIFTKNPELPLKETTCYITVQFNNISTKLNIIMNLKQCI